MVMLDSFLYVAIDQFDIYGSFSGTNFMISCNGTGTITNILDLQYVCNTLNLQYVVQYLLLSQPHIFIAYCNALQLKNIGTQP